MKISRSVLQKMYDECVRVESVHYMQLLTATETLPVTFFEIFNHSREEVLTALQVDREDAVKYGNLEASGDLWDYISAHKNNGVLIQFSTPVPSEFEFDEEGTESGSYSGCALSWGLTSWHFAYGETLKDALENATEVAMGYFCKCADKERLQYQKNIKTQKMKCNA